MKLPKPEPSVAELAAKIDNVLLGLKWTCCALLVCVSVPNIIAALNIEMYRQIFQDAFPGKPLPNLTEFVLGASAFLRISAFVLPTAGILNVIFAKRAHYWIIGSLLIVIVVGLLAFLTWISFFLPMNGIINGMSDAPQK